MTDDQHGNDHGQGSGQGAPPGGSRWDPLPQGDYDDGATAFVKLPEGGIDALLAARGDSPLAAPGHGYVPPQIAAAPPGADPGATGAGWGAPAGGAEWPAPATGPQSIGDDRFTYHPGSTGQWTFDDTTAPPEPAPGHDVTGQWSIPVAGGDLPDESGEFTTSSLVEQWGGTPPATLPGGAPAPWATGTTDQTWDPRTDQTADAPAFGHTPQGGPTEHGTARYEAPDHRTAEHRTSEHRTSAEEAGRHPAAAPHPAEQNHATGTFAVPAFDTPAPEISAEAYTVAPNAGSADGGSTSEPAEPFPAPVEAAQPASEAPEAPEASTGPSGDPEAAHGPVQPPASHTDGHADETAPGDTPPVPDAASEAVPDGDARAAEDTPPALNEEHPLASYALRVNGSDRPVTDAWIGESLLYVLRERLGLAGAKDGCSQGECGACNVQVDGRLVASCLVPAVTTAGSEIRTVEGLAADGQPSDVQRALARCGAVQCGFCVPGMAMTVHDLLEGNPAPSELEARQALCGNLCRCSGYRGVLQAVQDVVAEREAHAAGDGETDGDEARIPHQAGPGAGGVHASAFENPAQPHPHDPAYGQGQDGGQA
ncbi:2Fe-2S iron-sulfur cluster-binding protein [Streptomyces sp. NBC_01275]|uniref:2Fe-2S iron-sulfur cluster-binding protein n=1 Tax=Streptomyces sp. NBC_01275 TaxID=2903807 RepID=UPI002254432F|nr:2Fe-2S iron-sulfur cluster-binding protein [Streptomyces sp. NBC_01275]MCX4762506.1 2Fe-2S iron-sulfur cluster-binding protein [Streptomyces sp. NBC_01275]